MKKMENLWQHKKIAAFIALMFSASAAYSGALIDLSDKPLYATQVNAKPTLTLALSVEHPTVGAQYLTGYNQAAEYIGHFNPDLCYDYYNGSSENDRYFRPNSQPSVNHGCNGLGFSGNFMNWATASAIDILRYSLTGGDRVIDTPTLTVLQRAVIPSNFYNNGSNFPQKTITAAQALQAVPTSLRIRTNNATHTGNIIISNCLNRVYFSGGGGGSCGGTPSNVLGSKISSNPFLFTRVSVCTQNGDGSLQDVREVGSSGLSLCQQFPSGHYKPVGKLYYFSDEMRVAAFGYPLIGGDTATYYKGVLRAPMKFVGPNAYNSDYQYTGLNSRAEWDSNTGVFTRNPEGSSFGVSGVINYLNMFGRTGTQGNYVSNDRVNQLYYEALRYLQGMKPTARAVSSTMVNSSTYDGFPIYTTWDDPHPAVTALGSTGDYSCYRNHIIVIGDKNTHTDTYIPGTNWGRGYNEAGNEPNFTYWTSIAGAFEANANTAYTDGEGIARTTRGNPNPNTGKLNLATLATGSGNKSNYSLVGMAYWANTHDIRGSGWTSHSGASGSGDPRRPGMRVTSYFIDVNEAAGSNTVNQRLAGNQYHYAAKFGGFDARRSLGGNPFTSDGVSFSNALWQRGIGTSIASENFPQTYFLASDAQAVLDAFDNIFESIVTKNYSLAGMASSGGYTDTVSHGDIVFQGSFNGMNWTGDVTANTVRIEQEDDGTKKVTYHVIADWSPAEALTNRNLTNRPRNIVVGRGATSTAANFTWGNLTAEQRTALQAGGGNGPDIVAFLSGDRSQEGAAMRARSGLLGDISNAGAAYKGAPVRVSYDSTYTAFYEEHLNRTPVVYIGANDGMLHAFNADMGATDPTVRANEIFAYIPSFVTENLYQLADPAYNHAAYVDATPAVAEFKVSYNNSWRTVLVGGAGAGGQGVYALDVTTPESFKASDALWEFTDRDDPRMGNVIGTPRIVRISATTAEPGARVEYRWYALVPGGVNNEANDGHKAAAGSGPSLFILDLSKPPMVPWSLGVNYFRVDIPAAASSPHQGLLNITAVVNSKSRLHTIYAGDLSGRLWNIDLGTLVRSTSSYPVAYSPITPRLVFNAGVTKPITVAPTVVSYGDMTLVSFGTGVYLAETDTKPPYNTQTIFTVLDAGETVSSSVLAQSVPIGGNSYGVATPFTWAAPSVATSSGAGVRSGWYLNLPGSGSGNRGERVVYEAGARSGMLMVNSLLPSAGGCDLGSSRQYLINLLNGAGAFREVADELLGSVVFVNMGTNVVINPETGNPMVGSDSQGTGAGTNGPSEPGGSTISGSTEKSVLDWREIPNFEQLRIQLSE